MKDIHIIQHSYTSINSVFCFSNVLEEDYLNILLQKTVELTEHDKMNKSTNVLAHMTDYRELLNHGIYKKLFTTTLELLNFCFRLRSPHPNQKFILNIVDAWGLQHFQGDYTRVHTHEPYNFSSSFCLRNPDSDTTMFFDDFNEGIKMIENQLIIFPSSVKHYVNKHIHPNISRVSLAKNITMEIPSVDKK